MLPVRRAAASIGGARVALAAALTLASLGAAPAANAATGDLHQFGTAWGFGPDEYAAAGPVAVDADGGNVYVADLGDGSSLAPRIRKVAADGAVKGSVLITEADPSGQRLYVVGLALDRAKHRLYALVDADVTGDSGTAREILAFSTTPDCTPEPCTLVPADDDAAAADGVDDGVLIDFRTDGGAVDRAAGLAVDPDTRKVAVVGVADASAADPTGVIQYIDHDGTPETPISGLGNGLDPDGALVAGPAGLAIGAGGDVFVVADHISPSDPLDHTAAVYRLPRESGTATPFLTDHNNVLLAPGAVSAFGLRLGTGSPIAVSADGKTLWVEEGDSSTVRARGYDTTTKAPRLVYGVMSTSLPGGPCVAQNPGGAAGLAAGDGNVFVSVAMSISAPEGGTVHIYGDGGTGCPVAQGKLKVNGQTTGTVTVNKGQPVSFDATDSDLLGGQATELDWDLDNSGAFATKVTGSPADKTYSYKFLTPGTYNVGVKIQVDGAPPTDAVFRTVNVVAPTPTAAFRASTRDVAAGGTVTFDGGDSLDPAGSPTGGASHDLAKYRWDFGDGQSQETSTATVGHAFANGASAAVTRTVKLVVVSHDGVASNPQQLTVTVQGTSVAPPPIDTPPGPPKQDPPKTQPPAVQPPAVSVSAQGVDAKGTLSLKVTCPAGTVTCSGRIALTTKVKKKVKGRTTTVTVKLGTVAYTVDAGKDKVVKLKLSKSNLSLLKKQKRLSASAAVSVTAGGKTATSTKSLSLKAPAKATKRK